MQTPSCSKHFGSKTDLLKYKASSIPTPEGNGVTPTNPHTHTHTHSKHRYSSTHTDTQTHTRARACTHTSTVTHPHTLHTLQTHTHTYIYIHKHKHTQHLIFTYTQRDTMRYQNEHYSNQCTTLSISQHISCMYLRSPHVSISYRSSSSSELLYVHRHHEDY